MSYPVCSQAGRRWRSLCAILLTVVCGSGQAVGAGPERPRVLSYNIHYRLSGWLRLAKTAVIADSEASDHRPVLAVFDSLGR